MKRNPQNLSESLSRRLNSYALAAGAAGVSAVALGATAQAKIIYTPAHKLITDNHTVPLDLNHDGIVDFRLKDIRTTSPTYGFNHIAKLSIIPTRSANKAEGYSRFNQHYASALKAGVPIGPKGKFTFGAMQMAYVMSNTGVHRGTAEQCLGPWGNVGNRYLGLKFLIEGKVHFGWARLDVHCIGFVNINATLTGYAYETIPNKAIVTGKTKGPDVITVSDTLGGLAQGAAHHPKRVSNPKEHN